MTSEKVENFRIKRKKIVNNQQLVPNAKATRVARRATKDFPTLRIYFRIIWKRVHIYIGVQVPKLVTAYTICHQLFM